MVGVSTQLPEEQAAFAADNRIEFPLFSDADLALTTALRLPTFRLRGVTRLKRLTLVACILGLALYPDETCEVQDRLDAAVGRALPLEATDHLGVVSRLWAVTDQQTVSAVTGMPGGWCAARFSRSAT